MEKRIKILIYITVVLCCAAIVAAIVVSLVKTSGNTFLQPFFCLREMVPTRPSDKYLYILCTYICRLSHLILSCILVPFFRFQSCVELHISYVSYFWIYLFSNTNLCVRDVEKESKNRGSEMDGVDPLVNATVLFLQFSRLSNVPRDDLVHLWKQQGNFSQSFHAIIHNNNS